MLTEKQNPQADTQKRDHYDSISTETRRMLVKLTQEDGVSIRKASKALQIKYSTGKTLIQLYKKTGRIDRVKQQRAQTMETKHQVRKIIQKVLEKNAPAKEVPTDDNVSKNSEKTEEVNEGKLLGPAEKVDKDISNKRDEQNFVTTKIVHSYCQEDENSKMVKNEAKSKINIKSNIQKKDSPDQPATAPTSEEQVPEKSVKIFKISHDTSERCNHLRQLLKAHVNKPDFIKKRESQQIEKQKIEPSTFKPLVKLFNSNIESKSAFSSPSKLQAGPSQKVSAIAEANGKDAKMKLLNNLILKLAANRANKTGNGSQLVQNQLLQKPKLLTSPQNTKSSLLGKRTFESTSSTVNQIKDNEGAVQQIHQPIPKRYKLDDQSQVQQIGSITKTNPQMSALYQLLRDKKVGNQQPSQQVPKTQSVLQTNLSMKQRLLQLLASRQIALSNGEVVYTAPKC